MSLGLVLGGGGTRGSYHIGAYKALTELSKEVKAIVGTSIGAINGAVIAQGDFLKLSKLWENIDMEDILALPKTLMKKADLFDIKNTPELIREIYENKGIDSTPLRNLIREMVDEEKLKKSETDFSLVTYSVSDKKEIALSKYEIPDGEMVDYLLASAGFPGLKPVKIRNSVFIDGGVANNIPIDVLIKKGIGDIVVIDVGGVGFVKDSNISGKNIITVRSSSPVVGIMDFDDTEIRQNTKFGYFDTLKAFGKCVGSKYYLDIASYYKNREFYGDELLQGLEQAADVLGISIFKIYTVEELIARVCTEFRMVPSVDGVPEMLKKLNEKNIVCVLAKAIITENADFLGNKLVTGLLGKWYDAANAIAYFAKQMGGEFSWIL